jgi:methyltransferase-like protein
MFRQTLLCHADVKLDRALRPEALQALYIASSAKPAKSEDEADGTREFETPAKQKLATRDPLMKSAMLRLAEAWPASVAFRELAGSADEEQQRQFATRLINCVVSQIVEFSSTPSKFVVNVSPKPTASPYARLRARDGGKVTSMRLETVQLGDLQRKVLAGIDGTKTPAELAVLGEKDEEGIGQMLGSFARSALLIG